MTPRRILIIVDEITAGRELETGLTGFGYEVVAIASTGRDAIAHAERTDPHLLLMDMTLHGDMGGMETAEEIRRRRQIPVIFIAADSDDATSSAKLTEPFVYLAKPFTERELRGNIDLALCKHDMMRQSKELEDGFFAVSIDMLCLLDFNGYFKRLNPAWERTLGFTIQELTSRPFIEFVHPDDRERTLKQNARVRAGGHALGFENRYVCKDGSYRWLLWNAAPESSERVIYSVARDMTVRKQAEEERERLVRELQAALAEVRSLQEILPICSYCKKVRDDENYWQTVESYISRHTNTRFSHSICPTCYQREVAPQFEATDGE